MMSRWSLVPLVGGVSVFASAAAGQFPFSDDFESYQAGAFPCATAGCTGPGGWGLWHYTYEGGPRPADIVTGNAHSGTKAVRLRVGSDVIKTGELTSGRWTITAYTYFPGSLTAPTDAGYFILLDDCSTQPPIHFSSLLLFEGVSGQLKNTADPDAGSVPLVRDQWAELRIELDLDAGTNSVFYNGQTFYLNRPYAVGGARRVECLALFSDGVAGMLFDTISVQPQGTGTPPGPTPGECYVNCHRPNDPRLNHADFACFLVKYIHRDPYANCDGSTTEPTLDVNDFLCFMQRYHQGCD
jgi:hypothetical protein